LPVTGTTEAFSQRSGERYGASLCRIYRAIAPNEEADVTRQTTGAAEEIDYAGGFGLAVAQPVSG